MPVHDVEGLRKVREDRVVHRGRRWTASTPMTFPRSPLRTVDPAAAASSCDSEAETDGGSVSGEPGPEQPPPRSVRKGKRSAS